MNDVPLDLYIAGYTDPDAAKADFDALKKASAKASSSSTAWCW